MVERGDGFGQGECLVFDDQADAGGQFQIACHPCRDGQRHKRIQGVTVFLGQFAAAGIGRFAVGRDMRVLRHPYRIESAFFRSNRQLINRHRVVGDEGKQSDFHGGLASSWFFARKLD
jgi:hypothetical protein